MLELKERLCYTTNESTIHSGNQNAGRTANGALRNPGKSKYGGTRIPEFASAAY